jgi:thiosulfate dehydrogenase [quinone] large subunit
MIAAKPAHTMTEEAIIVTPRVKEPWSGATWGFLLIRLWVGFRMLLAGVDKFEKDGELSLETYAETTEKLRSLIVDNGRILNSTMESFFTFILRQESTPEWAEKTLSFCVNTFAYSLGWILIANGALLILGIFSRINLILAGLIYLGLSIGLMSLPDEEGIAWLGIHMGLVALALSVSRCSKLNLTPW